MWMLPKDNYVLMDLAYYVCKTEQAYFFDFLSLSLVRKARNATIRLPKVINKVNIPINKDKISYAVIVTHLPSYVVQYISLRISIGSGGYHPVMGTFPQRPTPLYDFQSRQISYQILITVSITIYVALYLYLFLFLITCKYKQNINISLDSRIFFFSIDKYTFHVIIQLNV